LSPACSRDFRRQLSQHSSEQQKHECAAATGHHHTRARRACREACANHRVDDAWMPACRLCRKISPRQAKIFIAPQIFSDRAPPCLGYKIRRGCRCSSLPEPGRSTLGSSATQQRLTKTTSDGELQSARAVSHYNGGTPRRRTCFWTSPSCPWMLGTSRSRSLRSPKYVVDCRAPPAPPLDSTAVLLPPSLLCSAPSGILYSLCPSLGFNRTSKELGTCRAPPAPCVSTLPCSPSPLSPSLSQFLSLSLPRRSKGLGMAEDAAD
jgi:hypothetical protein